ncbi:MAG: hypothetical protein D6730_00290 [Bacteroidetes bacterium]|nr:MAG: hypothetical protein D6730_00290 [Bacteroidota bacterium]
MEKKIYRKELVSETRIFKGAKDNPFLAPRGVFLAGNRLFVADTAQNRLFIWHQLPRGEFQQPDLVLGQLEKAATGRNANGRVSASSLFYPSGIWSDGQRLIVADAWNHRVLLWREMPVKDGQPADVVIGQPDFEHNEPNVKGIGHPPSAQTLNWPYGIWSDGTRLWIADTGNRRVLYYERLPQQHFAPADGVIGKTSFEERDYDHQDAIWPYAVKVSPKGALAITDTQYYRVLLWHDWNKAFSQKADAIIGQASFEGNGQNQFGWFPRANTLNWCYDTCFYKDGLWVADTGNSRILWFENLPRQHNAEADNLLGQPDFQRGSENQDTIRSTEGSLYWPFQVCIDKRTMVIADTGNHRVVVQHLTI